MTVTGQAADPDAQTRFRLGLAASILGAIGFAAKGVVVKMAYQHGVDSSTVVALRMLFALPGFLIVSLWQLRRGPPLLKRDWLDVVLLGFFGGYLTGVLDFTGLKFVSAGLERLIVYLTPTLVLGLEALLSRRTVGRKQVSALCLSYAGAALVLGAEAWHPGKSTLCGAILVFGSACTYAIYLVQSGRVVGRIGALRLTGLATSAAAVLCVAHFLALKPVAALEVPPQVLWLSLINGTLCTFVPVVLVMVGVERLGASLASQCGMVGPVATVTLGCLLLGEPFTPWVATGTLLVLAGIWLLAKSREPSPTAPRRAIAIGPIANVEERHAA